MVGLKREILSNALIGAAGQRRGEHLVRLPLKRSTNAPVLLTIGIFGASRDIVDIAVFIPVIGSNSEAKRVSDQRQVNKPGRAAPPGIARADPNIQISPCTESGKIGLVGDVANRASE